MTNKSIYAERALIIGIIFLVFAFYFHSQDFFTSKSSLIKQSGEIESSRVYYNLVKSSKGSISTKSQLVFKLKSYQSVFVLMENIGTDKTNKRFEELNKHFNSSGTVSVWIKKSQKEEHQPKVFQIADKNNTIIYTFQEAKSHSRTGFLFDFTVGLLGLAGFLIFKYWTNLFKTNKK